MLRGEAMKTLLKNDELISHMKSKGIKFEIVKESEAKIFLQFSNYKLNAKSPLL